MVKLIGKNDKEYSINIEENGLGGSINDQTFSWDIFEVSEKKFHILKNDKSYNVELLHKDEKEYTVVVNGVKYCFSVKDKYDTLLDSLGIGGLHGSKVSELKAPMPGLVLEIAVKSGKKVEKGETLLVLEAMKMENIIKSPSDGVVKDILVKKGETVDKNQVILNFQ